MRFDLLLQSGDSRPVLPYHYHSTLRKTIKKLLAAADADYKAFMQNKGIVQPVSLKHFPLFTFSNLTRVSPFGKEQRLNAAKGTHLVIALHLPKSAELFFRDLFLHQEIAITDQSHDLSFVVEQVTPWNFLPGNGEGEHKRTGLMVQPLSPLVIGRKNADGQYDFLSPDHPSFNYQLLSGWKEKYRRVYPKENTDAIFNQIEIKYVPGLRPFRSRLIVLHSDSMEKTALRGFERFTLHIYAPVKALELAGGTGLGLYNDWGMGCVAVKLR